MNNICKDCKLNKKGYCLGYGVKIVLLGNKDICLKYKKHNTNKITNNIKKKANKQEKKLAESLGATLTPQSGAQETSPSDMIMGNYVIESKATDAKSMSLKHEWLEVLQERRINMGRIPTLIIEFNKFKAKYVIMELDDFKKITRENKKEN